MGLLQGRAFSLSARKTLLLLMALALVLRVVAALTRGAIELDETVYAHMAEALAGGRGPEEITDGTSTNFLPVFPFFIAGVAAIFQDYVLSGYIVTITFGVLLLFPVYLLGKELAGEKIGLFAAALVAVNPFLIDLSTRLYSENLYMFFIVLAILFSRHMVRGCRVPCSILAGSALGFAYLVNPFSLFYLVIFIATAIVVAVRNGVWHHMLRAMAVFLVAFALYAAPLILFFHSELDRWTYTGKNPGVVYSALEQVRLGTIGWDQRFLRLTGDGDELVIDQLEADYDGPVSSMIEDPARAADAFLQQANIFYDEKLQQVFPRWLIPLMALGLFASGWNRKQAAHVGFLLLMLSPMLFLFFVDAVPRYFISYTPLLMIWAALGWFRVEQWGRGTVEQSFSEPRRTRLQRYVAPLAALIVTVPLLATLPFMLEKQEYPATMRSAGEWIKQEHGEGSRVMSREFTASYYAGATVAILPYADYGPTNEYARSKDVDYLVVSRNDISAWRPPLANLLADEEPHPEWKLVKTLSQGTDHETYIFSFEG